MYTIYLYTVLYNYSEPEWGFDSKGLPPKPPFKGVRSLDITPINVWWTHGKMLQLIAVAAFSGVLSFGEIA